MDEIKQALQKKIDRVKEAIAAEVAGTVEYTALLLTLSDLEESLADQDKPVLNTGNVCLSCEG